MAKYHKLVLKLSFDCKAFEKKHFKSTLAITQEYKDYYMSRYKQNVSKFINPSINLFVTTWELSIKIYDCKLKLIKLQSSSKNQINLIFQIPAG